ncbi:limulus clotting factor C [Dendroctonus ponderosae]|uniref:limulus clotting factor C n=1 Tax=Dendroctonus ponderosae TaxID=77166 RepID=UPI002035085C|nr:limulus clotting factor C [Dendroctonus ponderosae]
MLVQGLVVFAVFCTVLGNLQSPCPGVLLYEPTNPEEPDKWYGVITLGTDEDLEGVWVKVSLDREAIVLGNWFADATSNDNKLFNIANPQYKLLAGPPILIRFFVQYNENDGVPQVQKILLNGKNVCSRTRTATTQPTLHLSFRSTDPYGANRQGFQHMHPPARPEKSNKKPQKEGKRRTTTPSGEDDSFYAGDFSPSLTRKRTSVQCGTVAQRPAPLITYGESTSPGQWPWHAALYVLTGTELKYTCGATLVSDRHAVTAGHCVTKPRTNTVVQKDRLVVYLGKYSLTSFGGNVQDRQIEAIDVHPQYNASIYFNDIALLTLSAPIEVTDFVRPCCLWTEERTSLDALVGRKGTVVGWGINEKGELSQNLMRIELPVISNTDCLFSNRNFSQFLSHNNFCAGFQNDTAVCNGDSGGGMVFPRSDTTGPNTVWQLRGIVSLGVAKQSESVCDPKHYTVLTDAGKYSQWIKDTMKD